MNSDESRREVTPDESEARYQEFVALLARNDQRIRLFIRSLLPNSDGVDDVMQETAIECWNKFGGFRAEIDGDANLSFVRWASVVARYKVLSYLRDRSRDRLVFRESVIEQLAREATESLSTAEQERGALDQCLQKLNPKQQRLILSIYSPGESVAQIASETGQSSRSLYSEVNRLRKALLACVQKQISNGARHAT